MLNFVKKVFTWTKSEGNGGDSPQNHIDSFALRTRILTMTGKY